LGLEHVLDLLENFPYKRTLSRTFRVHRINLA
jgi:hypothetical protein